MTVRCLAAIHWFIPAAFAFHLLQMFARVSWDDVFGAATGRRTWEGSHARHS